jgi:8-oxo-dGTP pyrophosphatase MutT (NUDIX family)
MKKHKAIAIPVCLAEDRPVFLTIRDRRWKDWGFVAGGSRRREVNCPLRTALRELEEETRGTVCLRSGEYTSYVFTVKESPTVELVYNVYVFFVNFTKTQRAQMVKKFMDEKAKTQVKKLQKQPIKRVFDENDFMSWDTLEEFKARPKKWERITTNVIKNPEFYACLSAPRKTFVIK